MAFGIVDYILFGLTLLVSAFIGIYYRFSGGKQATVQEYLLGNRNQKVIPIAFSLLASFTSSISILGYSSEVYKFGTQFFVIIFTYIPAAVFISTIYLPVFYKLRIISIYEYLEKRFGLLTRFLASVAFIIQMVLYIGIVHYAPALALEAVTGISQTTSILVIGAICIFYCTIGGIKAVIFTDLFQVVVMFAAVIAVVITAVIKAGNFKEFWRTAEMGGRIEFSNFNLDPTIRNTWWSVTIGGMLTYIAMFGVSQPQVQRYLSMKDLKSVKKAVYLCAFLLMLFVSLLGLCGLSLYYVYHSCDPTLEGRITNSDQMLPLYVMDVFKDIPGLTGLFAAGIFSASLSTVSAVVNSLAAVTLEDYMTPVYRKYKKNDMSDTQKSFLSKIFAVLYGLLCLAVALLAHNYTSILQAALTVFGVVGGPLLGLFTLGMTAPSVGQSGAVTGFVTGLVFSFVIGFGGPKPPPQSLPLRIDGCDSVISVVYRNITNGVTLLTQNSDAEYLYLFRISYLYYVVLGFLITIIVGLIVSICFKSDVSQLNPDLFTPFIARRLKKRYQPPVYLDTIEITAVKYGSSTSRDKFLRN